MIAYTRVGCGTACPKSSADDIHLFTVGDCERRYLLFVAKVNENYKIKSLSIALGNTTFMWKKMLHKGKKNMKIAMDQCLLVRGNNTEICLTFITCQVHSQANT